MIPNTQNIYTLILAANRRAKSIIKVWDFVRLKLKTYRQRHYLHQAYQFALEEKQRQCGVDKLYEPYLDAAIGAVNLSVGGIERKIS